MDESPDELKDEYLVLKDAHLFFDDPVVLGSLKKLALRILTIANQKQEREHFCHPA